MELSCMMTSQLPCRGKTEEVEGSARSPVRSPLFEAQQKPGFPS